MKKPKILEPRANSFMTKTLKNIGECLPQMDYTSMLRSQNKHDITDLPFLLHSNEFLHFRALIAF